MTATTTCWDCNGTGISAPAATNTAFRDIPCARCHGSGQCLEIMREWMKRGEILRQKRERLDLSLREYARLHGWKSPELSDAERGRINPENFLNVQMEARRE